MIKLTSNIDDLIKFTESKIDNFKDVGKLKKIKDDVVEIIREDVANRFRNAPFTQGGFVIGNKEWKPVKDKYLVANPKRRNMPLLQDSGKLKDSLLYDGMEGSYVEYTDTGVSVGSELNYAKIQNDKRPILFWSEELKRKVIEYVAKEYTK